jgi:hypothetical protein
MFLKEVSAKIPRGELSVMRFLIRMIQNKVTLCRHCCLRIRISQENNPRESKDIDLQCHASASYFAEALNLLSEN